MTRKYIPTPDRDPDYVEPSTGTTFWFYERVVSFSWTKYRFRNRNGQMHVPGAGFSYAAQEAYARYRAGFDLEKTLLRQKRRKKSDTNDKREDVT